MNSPNRGDGGLWRIGDGEPPIIAAPRNESGFAISLKACWRGDIVIACRLVENDSSACLGGVELICDVWRNVQIEATKGNADGNVKVN